MMRWVLLLGVVLSSAAPGSAQVLTDTLLTWRSYSHERSARVRIFSCDDEARPHTVVVDERAESAGGPVTDEVRYVAEVVGRTFGFDPAEATFVFRFTAESFTAGEGDGGKAVLLFRRTSSGELGSPSWRVLSRDALDELTDRALF